MKSKALALVLPLFTGILLVVAYRAGGILVAVACGMPLLLATMLFRLPPDTRHMPIFARVVTYSNALLAGLALALSLSVFFMPSVGSDSKVGVSIFVLVFFFAPAVASAVFASKMSRGGMQG